MAVLPSGSAVSSVGAPGTSPSRFGGGLGGVGPGTRPLPIDREDLVLECGVGCEAAVGVLGVRRIRIGLQQGPGAILAPPYLDTVAGNRGVPRIGLGPGQFDLGSAHPLGLKVGNGVGHRQGVDVLDEVFVEFHGLVAPLVLKRVATPSVVELDGVSRLYGLVAGERQGDHFVFRINIVGTEPIRAPTRSWRDVNTEVVQGGVARVIHFLMVGQDDREFVRRGSQQLRHLGVNREFVGVRDVVLVGGLAFCRTCGNRDGHVPFVIGFRPDPDRVDTRRPRRRVHIPNGARAVDIKVGHLELVDVFRKGDRDHKDLV